MRFAICFVVTTAFASTVFAQCEPETAKHLDTLAAPYTCANTFVIQVESDYWHLCDIYFPTCEDFLGQDWGAFTEPLDSHNCPNVNCHQSYGKKRPHINLVHKVPVQQLPLGLNPNFREKRSARCSFQTKAEPDTKVYFRVIDLEYYNPGGPKHGMKLTVAWEMECPEGHDVRVHDLGGAYEPVQGTTHLYEIPVGGITLRVVRANSQKPAKTK
jgi:hypothetical protein